MSDVRDLPRARKDFSRGLRARDPEDLHRMRVPEPPPSLRVPLAALFLAVVVAPAVALFLFLSLFIAPRYESTSTFLLRGDVEHGGGQYVGLIASVSAVVASTHTQESGMLARFLPDRSFVERLLKKVDLRAAYSSENADRFWRLPTDASTAAVAGFWQGMSNVSVDPLSGGVTLVTTAFTPEDARRINEAALQVSEEMLNTLLEPSRRDALRIAEQDRQRASEELEAIRAEIEKFRRDNGVLDPQAAGSNALQLILDRRAERSSVAAELRAALASLSPQSAQVRSLKAQLAALDEQIAAMEADLANGDEREAVATLIAAYEELQLRRAFAEQAYTIGEMTLLRTKAEIERWHVYVVPVVNPLLPTEAAEPRPFAEASRLFAVCFIIWGIVSLLAIGTAEHRQ